MEAKKERINFMTTKDLAEAAKAVAFMEGITLSELICNLLQRHIDLNGELLQEYFKIQKRIKRVE